MLVAVWRYTSGARRSPASNALARTSAIRFAWIIAFTAKVAPVMRRQNRQWQPWMMAGRPSMRNRTWPQA